MDTAKCGGLLLLEVFSKEEVFGKEVIDSFIEQNLEEIKLEANFKTKGKLLQCLLAISKHLS